MFNNKSAEELNITAEQMETLLEKQEMYVKSLSENWDNEKHLAKGRAKLEELYSKVVADLAVQEAAWRYDNAWRKRAEEARRIRIESDARECQENAAELAIITRTAASGITQWWHVDVLDEMKIWWGNRINAEGIEAIAASCKRFQIAPLTLDDIAGAALVHRNSILTQNGFSNRARIIANSGTEFSLIKTKLGNNHAAILLKLFVLHNFAMMIRRANPQHPDRNQRSARYQMITSYFDECENDFDYECE